jgi:signal peptidase II
MAARRPSSSGPGSASPWRWLLDQITKTAGHAQLPANDVRTITPFFDLVRRTTPARSLFLAGATGWQRWFFIGLGASPAVFIVGLLARHGGQRFCWRCR